MGGLREIPLKLRWNYPCKDAVYDISRLGRSHANRSQANECGVYASRDLFVSVYYVVRQGGLVCAWITPHRDLNEPFTGVALWQCRKMVTS